MPRENVRSTCYSNIRLVVTWSKDGVALSGEDKLTRLVDVGIEEWPEGATNVDVPEGIYTHLDRDAINRLIRSLRRARDQVFGRDE